MKLLFIYINPRKDFDEEHKILAKIQIDNSLELGWKPEDIIMITNFPYEYCGIKAMAVDNNLFCEHWKYSSKINVLNYLFERDFFGDDLYWFHDFDLFQLEPITEAELGLDNVDVGFTDYGRSPKWNTGSFWFKKSAEDIFKLIQSELYLRQTDEEITLTRMTDINMKGINDRIKRLNITYNFGMRKIAENYERATKPLKCLHFHPYSTLLNTLARAMYGKNRIKKPLMTPRLIRIFNEHGIQ